MSGSSSSSSGPSSTFVVEHLVVEHLVVEHLVVEHLVVQHVVVEHLVVQHLVVQHLVFELVVEHLVVEHLVIEHLVVEHLVVEHLVFFHRQLGVPSGLDGVWPAHGRRHRRGLRHRARHPVVAISTANGRAVSRDFKGHWVLWDLATKAMIASGDAVDQPVPGASGWVYGVTQMVGDLFVLETPAMLELRSAIDGHVVAALPAEPTTAYPYACGLAVDGNYLFMSSPSGLRVWSPTGGADLHARERRRSRPSARHLRRPRELRVGRSTSQIVEYIDAGSGTSTLSGLRSWAPSRRGSRTGGRFFTTQATALKVYSKDVVKEVDTFLGSGGTLDGLAGLGDYFWSYNNFAGLHVYTVAAPTVAQLTLPPADALVYPSANLIGVPAPSASSMTLVHLDSGALTTDTVAVPTAGVGFFASDTTGRWLISDKYLGTLFDRDNILADNGPLSCGKVFAIAGADTGVAAVGTLGGVLLFDAQAAGVTLQGTLPTGADHVELSADGTVLGIDFRLDVPLIADNLQLLSLPSRVPINAWAYYAPPSYFVLSQVTLARGGTQIGRSFESNNSFGWVRTRTVTDLEGVTTSFTDHPSGIPSATPQFFVSPSGALVAAVSDQYTTNTYQNGALVDTVPGSVCGWLDDDRMLIDGNRIHSVSGAGDVAVTLPCSPDLCGVIGTNHLYCSNASPNTYTNLIYDLTTSAVVWTGSASTQGIGAVAGGTVVFAKDHQVYAETYTLPP